MDIRWATDVAVVKVVSTVDDFELTGKHWCAQSARSIKLLTQSTDALVACLAQSPDLRQAHEVQHQKAPRPWHRYSISMGCVQD